MRVFVAVDVGDAVRGEVTRVITRLTGKLEAVKTPPKVVWVKPNALHVTLRFIGEVEPPEVERLRELLAPPIVLAPFELDWRGVGTFPNNKQPRALWLGVINGAAPLAQVESEVSRRLAGQGSVEIADRAFLPHLTIGRVKMAGAGVDWPKLLQAVEVKRVASIVDRVTLYRSELSQRGPHYTGLVSAQLIGTAK
ncbi:MAG: RNA 2',3'-cyclic phosphodiesterase [Acidobacteriota bacterium]